MRDEYDFSNAKRNPYAKKLKKQITINIDENTNYEVHHIIPRAFGGLPQKISHKTRHKNLV